MGRMGQMGSQAQPRFGGAEAGGPLIILGSVLVSFSPVAHKLDRMQPSSLAAIHICAASQSLILLTHALPNLQRNAV